MKLHNIILTIALLAISQFSLLAQKPKVGLVLSGGGAKGFAHIGVLKVLEEEGLPISIIVGNSIGSIIGGVAATGYTAQEIEDMAKAQNWNELLFDYVPREYKDKNFNVPEQDHLLEFPFNADNIEPTLPVGIASGHNVLNLFCKLMVNVPDTIDFNMLPIPFACTATNLETGEEEVLKNGFLPKAILSSMAIPGMFYPVEYNGLFLIDGGVVNNYPSDVVKSMGAEIIIGVDISSIPLTKKELNSVDKVFNQISGFTDLEKQKYNKTIVDLNIKPDLEGYNVSSFTKEAVDTLILRGEQAARKMLPEIREIIRKYNLKPHKVDRKYVVQKEYLIDKINLNENLNNKRRYILKLSGLKEQNQYSVDEIQIGMNKLFGEGNFTMIYPSVVEKGDKYQLNINTVEKHSSMLKVGFGANSVYGVNLNLNYTFQDFTKLINQVTIDIRAAYNPRIIINAETHNYRLPILGLKIDARYIDTDFDLTQKIEQYDAFNVNADIYACSGLGNPLSNLQFGVRYDFNYSDLLSNNTKLGMSNTLSLAAYCKLLFDSFDKYFLPSKGVSFFMDFSMNKVFDSEFDYIPILYSNLKTVAPLNKFLALTAEVYHRSIYKDMYPEVLVNYASNEYSAYNDYYVPYAGSYKVIFTDKIVNSGMLGLRFQIANKHFVTPQVSTLMDVDKWQNIYKANYRWLVGINYSRMTILGPLNLSLNMSTNDENVVFVGGLGFQF